MMRMFEKTVSALCYEIARGHARDGFADPPYNDVVRFVLEQYGRMPRFLAIPMGLATIAFGYAGKRFHRLEPAKRRARLNSWTNSPIGPCRDLMRFYRSLVLLAVYSRPAERSA